MAATWDREAILDELQAIAPLTAVYGNTDGWALRHRRLGSPTWSSTASR